MAEIYKRVLVAHANPIVLRTLCRMVEEKGYVPVAAANLAQVLACLQTHQNWMAALVDYGLSDAPNGEVIECVKDSGTPILVLVDGFDMALNAQILQQGVVDCISKDSPSAFEYAMRMLNRIDCNPSAEVLMVDPNLITRQDVSRLLRQQLFVVHEVSSAEAALAFLHKRLQIALVLTVYDLPDMNGLKLTSEIRRFRGINELAIMGLSPVDSGMSVNFIKAGAYDFLNLPFSEEELLGRVMRNLEFLSNLSALEKAAHYDTLTGLSNRRHFYNLVGAVNTRIAVAMIDIDHFKKVNDTYGHAAGDEAIVFLSTLLKRFFADKITARFGGEEFVVLIEDLNLAAMHGIMNDFRLAVALSSVPLPNELMLTLTVSIGFAVGKAQDIANLLKVADDGLYVAKRNGRNQIFSTQSLEQVRIEGQSVP